VRAGKYKRTKALLLFPSRKVGTSAVTRGRRRGVVFTVHVARLEVGPQKAGQRVLAVVVWWV